MGAILPLKRYNSAGVSPTKRGRAEERDGPRGTRTGCLDGPAHDPDALRLVLHHGRLLPAPLWSTPVHQRSRGWKLRCRACDSDVHVLDGPRPGLDAPPPGAVRLQV